MRRFGPVLAGLLTAALLAATPASGQPAPSVELKNPRGGIVETQQRPFRQGDRYRFVSETVSTMTGGDFDGRQTNRQMFDVEVIGGGPDFLVLRYTLREATIDDPRQPGIDKVLRAMVGVPVEFKAYPSVTPREMVNGEAAKAHFFRNLEQTAPGDSALRKAMEDQFARLEKRPEGLAALFAGDLGVMAGMQIPAITIERTVIPDQIYTPAPGVTVTKKAYLGLENLAAGRCEATYSRGTVSTVTGAPEPQSEDLKTTATLSIHDGWVLRLSEVSIHTVGPATTRRELKITRQGDPPGCG